MLGGHAVALTLKTAGVKAIFTLCGGHICGIYDGCLEHDIEVIDVRHEQSAVHAADAWSRVSRSLGVAVLTAGPGVTDGVTGVVNAYFANSPVLVIAGAPKQGLVGRGTLQEMDQGALFEHCTKARFVVGHPDRITEILSQAIHVALSGIPGPVYVEVPFDVVTGQTEQVLLHQATMKALPQAAHPETAEQIAGLVAGAKRPVLFCGSSVWWDDAEAEVQALAARGLPVFVNGMSRGVLPPSHPALFMLSREHAFRNTDLLIVVGAPLDFRMAYGTTINPEAKLVQIDRDPNAFGKNRASDLQLHADSKSALRAIVNRLKNEQSTAWAAWTEVLRGVEHDKGKQQKEWEKDDTGPLNQFRIGRAIANIMDEDTIIIGDGGYVVTLAAKVIQPHRIGNWLDPSAFGTLGVGPGFALAAKRLRPKSHVILLSGDGAFGLNGFDIETCVRFNCPITVVVGNDAAWGQILVPQIQAFGRDRVVGCRLAPIRYDKLVEVFGGRGEHVDNGQELDAALQRAKASNTVYCIDAAVDPEFVLRNKLAKLSVL